MPSEIIKTPIAVLNGVLARLADPIDGYNATVAAIAADAGVTIDTPINFAAGTNNFWRANLSLEQILGSGFRVFPAMTLFIADISTTNRIMNQTFFGTVQVGVNVFISNDSQLPPVDQAVISAVVLSALMSIFGDMNDRDWGDTEITALNNYGSAIESLSDKAGNWADRISFRNLFECGPIPVI